VGIVIAYRCIAHPEKILKFKNIYDVINYFYIANYKYITLIIDVQIFNNISIMYYLLILQSLTL